MMSKKMQDALNEQIKHELESAYLYYAMVAYLADQGLADYFRFNDPVTSLLQHPRIRAGFRPDRRQLDLYILALYNLDMFRQEMADGRFALRRPLAPAELQGLAGDDEQLLLLAIRWLMQEFFAEET